MTRKKAKTKKKPRASTTGEPTLRRYVVLWGVSALVVLSATWIWFHVRTPQRPFSDAAVESVLMSAEIDPKTDVVRRTTEHGAHWKIKVPDPEKKATVIKALEKMADAFGGSLIDRQKKMVSGKELHLVTVKVDEAPNLSLLFVVDTQGKANKRPSAMAKKRQEPRDPDAARPKIAIILDDVGRHPTEFLSPLLDLRFPLTFSILPDRAYATENAISLHQKHYEVMLHLPMEPFDYPQRNPGEGAIMCHMNEDDIRATIERGLHQVPFACGVNNHMGSKVTANRTLMTTILAELKRRDLFFVDSRTHDTTVAFETAQAMGVRSGERRVFLDSERTFEFSAGQLDLACSKADEEGQVIVIGHPYPTTMDALVARMPDIDRAGYEFVFVNDILRGNPDQL